MWRTGSLIAISAVCLPAPSALAQALDEIMVTGSRLARDGFSSPTPVTVMTAEDMLNVRPTTIVETLAELPAFGASTTRRSIGGSTAAGPGSFLNLRGLGSTRNLVLLDGRRAPPSNISGNTDINMLPQSLISRVEVVTGGASAAYGTDAVAGVSNFILDKTFEGFKGDIVGGTNAKSDGENYRVSLAWGSSFLDGRLHVIASADQFRSRAAEAGRRDWASQHCAVVPVPGVTPATQSPTNPAMIHACNVSVPHSSYGGAVVGGPLTTPASGLQFGEGGVPLSFMYGTNRTATIQVDGDPAAIPVGNWVNFTTPLNSRGVFTHATYEVTPNLSAFVQLSYNDNTSSYPQTIPFFQGATGFTIFRDNAFLPETIRQRMDELDLDSFLMSQVRPDWGLIRANSQYYGRNYLAGLEGAFGDGWTWDAYVGYSENEFTLNMDNVSLERTYRAVDAVVDPATGRVVCQSSLADPANACVPLNPFGPNSASAGSIDYIRGTLWNTNDITQDTAGFAIRGEPVTLWAGPLGVAAGVEYMKREGTANSDPISQNEMNWQDIRGFPASLQLSQGGWRTNNPKPLGGSSTVKEAFVEVLLPLATDESWAESLELNAAARLADYSNSGSNWSWKVGLAYQIVESFRLRATHSRDTRAPSINELFRSTNEAPASVTDLDPTSPFFNQPVDIKTLGSGNPFLVPEEADTWTAGFVYQPSFAPAFGLSVDYYDIHVKQIIGTVAAQETVRRCYEDNAPQFCSFVQRDEEGRISRVLIPSVNLSAADARGVDFEVSYRTALSELVSSWNGALGVRLIGHHLLERSTTVPSPSGAVYLDRAGDIGQNNPEWQWSLLVSYDNGPFGINLRGRYVGEGLENNTPARLAPGAVDYNDVSSMFTLNLGARYRFQNMGGEPELYLNVVNLLDEEPPVIGGTALTSAQTNPSLYDTNGRAYALGVRFRF